MPTTTNTPTSEPMKTLNDLLGALQRHRQRHRDHLRADDLVQVPAEAVGRAVLVDHGLGCRLHAAVALQAGRVGDAQRPRQVTSTGPTACRAADHFLQVAVAAELVDHVDLPAGGAVTRVGGVERGFLVEEVRVLSAAKLSTSTAE
jgi:hypothetical protein